MPIDLSIPLGASSEYATLVEQNRFRVLFNSDVIGMAVGRCDGTFVEVNEALAKMVGYTRDELRELGWRQITAPDSHCADDRAIEQLETTGNAKTFEKELVHKDGSLVPILIGATRTADGHIIVYVLDNGGRKRAETALAELNAALSKRITESNNELRSLAAHLHTVREEQNTKLAREIHDVLGQELTGLRLDAAWVARRLGDTHPDERERLDEMQARIDTLINTVREIARELRPRVLDDLGLGPALQCLAREWSSRTQIAIELEVPESFAIDRERATAMFRIFQELLTNVARHAGATCVRARVFSSVEEQHVGLDFEDDGCGMTPDVISGSLGLVGIRERLSTFNGELAITSASGRGTQVRVRLPLGVPGCAS
ncbi:MAG: PAS domain S-box protein [Kofleriaceae bacterium]